MSDLSSPTGGQGAAFVPLRSFDNYIEANIVLNMLQHYDINCHLKDENIITINPLLSPAIGGMKLMVHEAHVARAWDLMENAEAEYLKTVPCPVCKQHALTTANITKEYKSKLSILANILLTGQSVETTKIYQCTACGYDFKELPE